MVRPYLIPKLWSLTYIFINNSEIDFFAKFTTVFFPIIILITCLDDIYEYQKLRDYLKFAFFCLFFYFQRNFILTGYVDIPLVSLITCFFYYLRRNDKFSSLNFSIVSIILSIVIKLSGLFSLFYFFIINKRTYLKKLILFLIITFYFFLLYKNNFNNFFTSKIFNEMGQMNNFNLFNTINYSYHLLINANLHYITLLSFTGLFLKTTRKIFLIFIFPGLLYWTFLLSYDFRNMLFTIPAIIIVNSIVIEKIFFKIKFLKSLFILLKKINIKKINLNINFKLIYATIIIFLIIFSYYFDNEKLFKNNYDRKFSMIGNKEINIAIKSLILENKINKDNFVTDFQLIFFIPAFKDHFSWNDNFLDENKVNLDEFDYYLIYGHQKKIRKLIKTKIEQNKSLMLLNKNNFILVGKNN